jgi:hypothetical protein
MSIFDGPPDFATMKDRAIKRAMREGAAVHIEILAEQTRTIIPADKLFTRDDVIALLEGMAQGMRGDT